MKNTLLRRSTYLSLGFIISAAGLFGQATWIGPDNGLWSVSGNWSVASGTAPINSGSFDLIFNSPANRVIVNDLTNVTANSLTVSGGSDNYLSGNAITLAGNFTVQTGAWQRTTMDLALSGSGGTFDIQSGFLFVGYDNSWATTAGGVISGSNGVTKTGGGVLSYAKANTYTGGTVINAGTLQLDYGDTGTGAMRGVVTINSGGTINSKVKDSFGWNVGVKVDTLNVNGGSLIHNTTTGNLTFSSMQLNMTGGSIDSTTTAGFDLYDANGTNTTINTLASASTATIAGKMNLRAGDNDAVGTVFTVADGAAANDLVVSAIVANGSAQGVASMIQKSGAGRMVLSAANTYTGVTKINAGTLALGINDTFADTSNFNLAGGTLDVGTFTDTVGTLTLSGNSAITLGSGGAFVFADSSAISWGSNTLSISGTFLDGVSIRFGSTSGGLTSTQLSLITINGLGASINSSGFLTTSAIPEPSTYSALAGLGILGFAASRRRRV
jgi:autotransporter-associated beta strand protein